MKPVLNKVLKKITPSGKEQKEFASVVKEITEHTKKIIKPFGFSHIVAGSFSRGTWLPHKKEFDLFILFPEEESRERLEKLGLDIGKKIVKDLEGSLEIAYAEHPYVRSWIKGFQVDIVPCYKVKSASKIKSAVDRTPFHNQYLDKHLKNPAEVRLLKQFCKGIGVYGSDLKTQGFSGYLCELLTINYKSFENLTKEASKWEAGKVFTDLESIYQGDKKEFYTHPLIVIDPVDPKRNVAAALSPFNFVKFVESCKEFVNKPTEAIFFPKELKLSRQKLLAQIKSRGTQLLILEIQKPDIVEDILYPQLRKAAYRLASILGEQEFVTLGWDVFVDKKCYILLELEVWDLPNIRKVVGPPIFSTIHSHEFLKKYKPLGRMLVEEDKWIAEIKRKFLTAEDKLKEFLKSADLKEKGMPSYIADSLFKGFKINKSTPKSLEEFLFKYLNKKLV